MGFRRLDEEQVYKGSLISVARGTYEAPDGSAFEREVVHHPGAVVVVPVTDDGTALLVRQYRAAPDATILELPAGKRDVKGEDPERTAERELAEEIGKRAGRVEKLAEFYNSPGFSDEYSYLYLARDLTDCERDAQGVEEGHMTLVGVPLADAPAMIESGRIVDAKTIIGLTVAGAHLAGEAR